MVGAVGHTVVRMQAAEQVRFAGRRVVDREPAAARRQLDEGDAQLLAALEVRELELEPGSIAVAVVKATTVIVETPKGTQ